MHFTQIADSAVISREIPSYLKEMLPTAALVQLAVMTLMFFF